MNTIIIIYFLKSRVLVFCQHEYQKLLISDQYNCYKTLILYIKDC
uniref:Uncharacterized protein n=1 Tax=Meloidogyne enterolobii TaxID=390850 RepID=A0A6V7X0I9_MELEN|nr:unnamed protein product [Meloidogyne enterolobii]